MIAERFEGDAEELEAFESEEGKRPVEEVDEEIDDEEEEAEVVWVELVIKEELDSVDEVVRMVEVVLVVEEVELVVDELVEVGREEELVVVGRGAAHELRMVDTGTEVTTKLVSVTVRASVVVLSKLRSLVS